jgi:hypothetical protein
LLNAEGVGFEPWSHKRANVLVCWLNVLGCVGTEVGLLARVKG